MHVDATGWASATGVLTVDLLTLSVLSSIVLSFGVLDVCVLSLSVLTFGDLLSSDDAFQETSAQYGAVEPSSGSNVILRRACPGLVGRRPHSVTLSVLTFGVLTFGRSMPRRRA